MNQNVCRNTAEVQTENLYYNPMAASKVSPPHCGACHFTRPTETMSRTPTLCSESFSAVQLPRCGIVGAILREL